MFNLYKLLKMVKGRETCRTKTVSLSFQVCNEICLACILLLFIGTALYLLIDIPHFLINLFHSHPIATDKPVSLFFSLCNYIPVSSYSISPDKNLPRSRNPPRPIFNFLNLRICLTLSAPVVVLLTGPIITVKPVSLSFHTFR